jgi:5-methylcytosine-specific restriction enzyme subunit McrC
MLTTVTIERELSIREHDVLLRGESLAFDGSTSILVDDWDWLNELCKKNTESPAFFQPVYRSGVRGLQATNYVGTVETPSGTRIEILPKSFSTGDDPQHLRQIVLKMLSRVLDLNTYSWEQGALAVLNQPLHEHLIGLFLLAVEHMVKKGIRSSYVLREDEQPFLRGRLRVEKQLHRRPGSKPEFSIVYHEFIADRPENRLIHSAILAVSKWTRNPNNQRRARSLRFVFSEILISKNFKGDFQQWSHDRSLIHYRGLKPWCELILGIQSPLYMAGAFSGLSFLFPMEQLFERYVATILSRRMHQGFRLVDQPSRHSLVKHQGADWFRLKPDLLIERRDGTCISVLDTKWKRIDQSLNSAKDKYNLSQADFYQMAAYGERYLNGKGDMFLIYPKTNAFEQHMPPFLFSPDLRLWVVPFDLEHDEMDIPEKTAALIFTSGVATQQTLR